MVEVLRAMTADPELAERARAGVTEGRQALIEDLVTVRDEEQRAR